MKKFLLAALLVMLPAAAFAQTVTQLPVYIQNNIGQVADFGNGPLELRVVQGSAQLFTAQGSGIGGNAATSGVTVTLTAAPAVPPCVGCLISGTGITSGTTVVSISGVTVTMSAAMSVATGTPLAWGAACPATLGASFPVMNVQATVGPDLPLFTQARICGASQYSAGATVLPFAIGAH